MPSRKRKGLLIAGGGLAGSLAALALLRNRPDVPFLIVEAKPTFGGDRFRTVFGGPLDGDGRRLLLPMLDHLWPGYFIAFPGLNRKFRSALAGFPAQSVHREMMAALQPDQYLLNRQVVAVREDRLILEGGETIEAEGAIDARGAPSLSILDLLYETRVERVIRLDRPHGLDRPVLIDAHEEPDPGFAFTRIFPLGEDRLLVARALVSERAHPDESAETRLDHYLEARGWNAQGVDSRQVSVRPLPVGGDFDSFWRIGGARVARLGRRGGFIHPATGSGVQDSVRNALRLSQQRDFSGPALHRLFADEASALWKRRQIFRDLNRKLKTSPSSERQVIVRGLYEMDSALVARFHGDRLGRIDRLRLARRLKI